MAGQPEELPCPFCDKGKIYCLYFPGAWSVRSTKTGSLPGGKTSHKSSDVWIIKSGCSICGKTPEELEKELKRRNII